MTQNGNAGVQSKVPTKVQNIQNIKSQLYHTKTYQGLPHLHESFVTDSSPKMTDRCGCSCLAKYFMTKGENNSNDTRIYVPCSHVKLINFSVAN